MTDSADSPVPTDPPVPREAVEVSQSPRVWSVSGGGWDGYLASLPDEYAALLAPPIVVQAASTSAQELSRVSPQERPQEPPRAELPERAMESPGEGDRPIDTPQGRQDGDEAPSLELLIFEQDTSVPVPAPPRAPGRHRRR